MVELGGTPGCGGGIILKCGWLLNAASQSSVSHSSVVQNPPDYKDNSITGFNQQSLSYRNLASRGNFDTHIEVRRILKDVGEVVL